MSSPDASQGKDSCELSYDSFSNSLATRTKGVNMDNTTAQILLFLLFAGAGLIILFAPARAAYKRKHKNRRAIMFLNLLGGWSIIGWIAAFVWAQTNDVEAEGFEITKKEKKSYTDALMFFGLLYLLFWALIWNAVRG